MKRFLTEFINHLSLALLLTVVLMPTILIGSCLWSCSPEAEAMARAEARAEKEAEYERLCIFYYKVYDRANDCYWKLANEYQDLYNLYLNDPGRTESLDGFTDPRDLEFALPEELEDNFID